MSTQVIEEESGTSTHCVHSHNGYYAGDFSADVTDLSTSWTGTPLKLCSRLDLIGGSQSAPELGVD